MSLACIRAASTPRSGSLCADLLLDDLRDLDGARHRVGARLADMLRTDVSEDEMIEWLQGVLTFLAPRPDLVGQRLRRMIDKFVASGVLKPCVDKYGELTP